MTPVLSTSRRTPTPASPELIQAASLVREAAEMLASEATEATESARFLRAADRLATAIESPNAGRQRLIFASPALVERSGRVRSLVEMIEDEPGDDAARLRLAKLLFRALLWTPESFPPACH